MINAYACMTTMGGSIMPEPVVEAMVQASRCHVPLEELQLRAGERLAALTGAEGAFICTGAASGLLLAGAACLAGIDRARIERLPDTDGRPNEFVISMVDPHYYVHQGFRLTGGKLVEVGTRTQVSPADYEAALSARTAACVFFLGRQPDAELPQVARIAHAAGVPLIVDAADQLPPRSNLTEVTAQGADLVVFSGGKGLRGPQCSGLILGRKDLVEACRQNSSPYWAAGRGMKVGKEEIAGLLVAVELFLARDEDAVVAEWERRCHQIGRAAAGVRGVTTQYFPPFTHRIPPSAPHLHVVFGEGAPLSAREALQALERGEPSIVAQGGDDYLRFATHTLEDGEAEVICCRLREILGG
jgi:L-seryl-tRNA(Ser) seleniumtransferase